jgi:predicted dehydrogenase
LVAGAFCSEAKRSIRSAKTIGISADRSYADYKEMAEKEQARTNGIEAVVIVTPNHLHLRIAEIFLKAGIHVICDKPLSATLEEAQLFAEFARKSDKIFALTYNYSGYPMVRHARALIAKGQLGEIRTVQIEYAQDWLSEKLEDSGHKQATWRTDPEQGGKGGLLGDIGTHAFHLSSFVSGLQTTEILADLNHFVEGRSLDDNAHILLRFSGGAKGMLWVSQVAPGNENSLRLRIYGSKAGIEWSQENPNYLKFSPLGEPSKILGRGSPELSESATKVTRTPPGHPEGYIEGFANIYTEIAQAVYAAREGKPVPQDVLFPDLEDGIAGMIFIEAALNSSRNDGKWVLLNN